MDSKKDEVEMTVEASETFSSSNSATEEKKTKKFGKFVMPPLYEKPTLSQPGKILGIRRKWFLIGAAVFLVVIIAILVGAGLAAKNKKKHQFLPLPGGRKSFKGDATYYGTGLGACGIESKDSEYIVAIAHSLWDSQSVGSNPNANPLCGRKIRATRYRPNNEAFQIGAPGAKDTPGGENVSVDVTVVDRCTGCEPTDLDFSPAAFGRLADQAMGRVLIQWTWL